MKKLAITRAVILAVLMVTAISSDLFASIQFRTLKSDGFSIRMSSAVKEVIKAKVEKSHDNDFFRPAEPCCSRIGAVKTFTIVKVERKKSTDKFDIRGTVSNESDSTASRFLNRPINGVLTSGVGYRIHPKRKKRHFHSGIDLAAKKGTPISCAASGKVVFAGWKTGYGYVVLVDHGKGYETLYAHCSKLAVTTGQTVSTGKIVAYVGRTGVATGPHLHFEVRKNGVYRNPLKYLKN
jgi:murein DD-endopeptidase MepM/ murein hydrolase activator NlpD